MGREMSDIELFDQRLTDSTRAKFNRILTQLDIALAALKAVEEHKHCKDGQCIANMQMIWEHGCMEGHRCAAAICKQAREEISNL
jgi:hypothetical protein